MHAHHSPDPLTAVGPLTGLSLCEAGMQVVEQARMARRSVCHRLPLSKEPLQIQSCLCSLRAFVYVCLSCRILALRRERAIVYGHELGHIYLYIQCHGAGKRGVCRHPGVD